MKTLLALVVIMLAACGVPSFDPYEQPNKIDSLPTTTCGVPNDERQYETAILADHHICNDCWRQFHGPNTSCGQHIIAIGSCVENPKISWYKVYGTEKGDVWFENGRLTSIQLETRNMSGGSLVSCSGKDATPCSKFNIEIVWCK